MFFVKKKDGAQRMVVDARLSNQAMRPPPKVRLGGADSLSSIDLSPEARAFAVESLGTLASKEFDPHYEGRGLLTSDGASTLGLHEHRHVCTVGTFSGLSFMHFPLYGFLRDRSWKVRCHTSSFPLVGCNQIWSISNPL